ncbi:tail fiber protein [Providencia phage vB_PstP_PS3]|uniref:Tail fiber protein n=1 Tax=Providencia phage vB_PstP_PS3 TaxID=2848038 RepID=A0A411AWE2_9CAUD|nr:tail fiber protein [Providencia phage vB_PstP_PS3]QAX92390.1 tail fiber protein [Providencia phage vB_PstP_PS3]
MAKVNRTVLHDSVPTFQEFSTGGVVRTKYDLFKNKDGLWEWHGTFPKTVPAGSTPESTGGIWSDTNPDGLWVNVGDVSLREDLISGDGALIGVGHGTLKDAIGYVTPEMFGDVDGDAYEALQAAFSSDLPCKLSARTYRTSRPLYYDSGKVIEGAGELFTRIVKYSDSTSGLGQITINGKEMDYEVDAILIARGSHEFWYTHFNRLSGFSLLREGTPSNAKACYGLYAPLICQSSYSQIHIEGRITGVYTVDAWMINWDRVESKSDAPWKMGAAGTNWVNNGTSNVFNACWAHSSKNDNYAWDFENFTYTIMNSCGTDFAGSNNNPSAGVYRFKNTGITLNACGAESIHCRRFMRSELNSQVTMNGCNFMEIYNKYHPEAIKWNDTNSLFQAISNSTLIFNSTSVNAKYDFGGDKDTVSSLAHAVDRSCIIWDQYSRSRPLMKSISRSTADIKSSYGISWNSASKVRINTEGLYIEDISDGSDQNLNKDVANLEYIHKTNRALITQSYIESKSFPLSGGHLDDLRVRGNLTFHSGSAANNTVANGYPEDGGAYFIKQYSTGGVGTNTRTIQEAIKTDDIGWVYKWVRGAEWGKPFGAWRKVEIN